MSFHADFSREPGTFFTVPTAGRSSTSRAWEHTVTCRRQAAGLVSSPLPLRGVGPVVGRLTSGHR